MTEQRTHRSGAGAQPAEYVVLLPADESGWATAGPTERERVYGVHREFVAALATRGHRVAGGAELTRSTEAVVLRTDADGTQTVTAGPYAESVEQLTGFYVVESTDLDDLVDVCRILGRGEGAIEIRRTVAPSDPASDPGSAS